jgi:hypothetical protein
LFINLSWAIHPMRQCDACLQGSHCAVPVGGHRSLIPWGSQLRWLTYWPCFFCCS